MRSKIKTESIDVVMLCGGKGERLKPAVNDRPKVLAEIHGKPFLDILIDYVASFRFKRFILCVGYKAELIRQYYKEKKSSLEIIFSEEERLLGTGGAIKNAQHFIKSSPFLVMNGDSFCNVDFNNFIDYHKDKKALFSVALVNSRNADDYGTVSLNDLGEVVRFDEKMNTAGQKVLINTGIYLFENIVFSMIPTSKNFSIEYELFQKIINFRFYGYKTEGRLTDIGTPYRYKQAQLILKGNLWKRN